MKFSLSHKDQLKLIEELISQNCYSTIADFISELKDIEEEINAIDETVEEST